MKKALQKRYSENSVLCDRTGAPSVMVYVPKFDLCDVLDGAPQMPHPAFVREGCVLDGIYVSKFQNVVENGLAHSLPDRDPATHVDFDEATRACEEKGEGWHLMTAMEWGAIALWCQKNGCLPYGNNDLGKDVREADVVARISYRDEEKGICRTATGTGPVAWSHNRREDGIWDLNGNVWEWSGGLRLVRGELQLQQSDGDWCAINAHTGACICPNGEGTTADSVKLDMIDGAFVFVSGALRDAYPHARFCDFAAVRAADDVCDQVRLLLAALGLLPMGDPTAYEGVALYANNGSAERMLFRGGRWGQGLNAGLFKSCIDDPRTYRGDAVGFRAAYVERFSKA
jgi:hypothetical protein